MSFDLIVYSKIKLHYEKNIKAFKDVGDKWRDVKISFDRYNGQFTAEGDFSRTFLNKQREGNTASSVDGFLYPIAALCHIACYKGLSSRANKKKFEDDLTAIMGGLNRLKTTYAKEKNKGAHLSNIEDAIFACDLQTKILKSYGGGDKGDYTSFCHKEFFRAVELDFTKNRVELAEVLTYLNTDIHFRNKLQEIVGLDIEETFNSKKEPTLLCINPDFIAHVGALKGILYKNIYSKSFTAAGKILPSTYLTEMIKAKRRSHYGGNYPSDGMHYQDKTPQKTKESPDEIVVGPDGSNVMTNDGNFLWFEKINVKNLPSNRIYLNVKPTLDSHKAVLTEMLNIIANREWCNDVGSFKFTHLGSIRNDTVCIYGDNAESLKKFAAALKDSPIIASNLNNGVANLQKQLFPGIGIGMGAEPGDWVVGKGNLNAFKGKHLTGVEKIGAIRFSYGSHRCFLISWGMVRAGRDGINWSDEAYNDILIFKIAEILADHGIYLDSIHEASIKFDGSYFGALLNNFLSHKEL